MQSLKHIIDTSFPGVSASYRHLRDYLRFRRLKPYQTAFGFQLYGDHGLDISRSTDGEVEIFLRYAKQVDVILDVGANVGFFTCLSACEKMKVLAFEPNADNLRCLYRNLETNSFSGVEVFPLALSDRPSVSPLFGGGQGATLLQGWGGIQSNYQRLTPVNTLDNLVYRRFKDQRLLIKMDVEGNEFRLLQGAELLLAKHPAPIWLIEHGLTENFDDSCNPYFHAIFQMFWDLGYQALTVEKDMKPVTSDDVNRWVKNKRKDFGGINYLFIRA